MDRKLEELRILAQIYEGIGCTTYGKHVEKYEFLWIWGIGDLDIDLNFKFLVGAG